MGTYLLRYKFRVFIIVFCLFITGGISYFIPVLSQKVMDDGFLKNDHHLVLLLAFYLFDKLHTYPSFKIIKLKNTTQLWFLIILCGKGTIQSNSNVLRRGKSYR